MIRLPRIVAVVCGLVVLAFVLACGGFQKGMQQAAQQMQTQAELQQLGSSYQRFSAEKGKGPANTTEWADWAKTKDAATLAIINQTGPNGKYVIFFGLKIPDDFPDGTSNTILGHESKTPKEGGAVLMADGTTKVMTAAEFSSAKKPKKK
jgi:hypothetical protein